MILLTKILLATFFFFLQASVLWGSQTVKIGILAKRGPAHTLEKWSQTADYLSFSIQGYHFEVVPLGFQEIHTAVKEGEIDFVLANSAFYVELEKLYGVSRIATLINQHISGQQTTTFGGVIFSRADRKDIKELKDIQGKDFMAVDPRSFGGWHMAWREFKRKSIAPLEDFSSMHYGSTHDDVVYAVLDGDVDAGTVRTDTLERMSAEGKIRLELLHVLHSRTIDHFPFMISTDLYPEWPIAAIKTTPTRLSRIVASALMAMDSGHPAATASKSAGWTIPLNYQPVHDCLLELRISPYEDYGKFTLKDVLQRYWQQVSLVVLAVMITIVASLYILQLNRSLSRKKDEVDDLNRALETKVIHRTEKIRNLLDREIYLKEILHIVADVDELLITSPTLKSLLIESCARFVQHEQYGFCWIGLLEKDKLQTVYTSHEGDNYLADPPYAVRDGDDIFSRGSTARCIALNKTVISVINDQEADTTPWREPMKGFQAVIGLPLRADQFAEPLGVITVYTWRKKGCEPEEINMLEELAGDIGFAINSFRQKEAVTRLEHERTANYEETIFSMVNMIEHRDTYTAGHTARVARYAIMIAQKMGLDDKEIKKLQKAAMLHDIGKIATPDSILLKPGKLSHQDHDLIKLHAVAGYEMLAKVNMYKELAVIIRHHHERYDGKGYPDRLQGEDIPLLSSIMTVADAFDAMTTNRIYKARKETREALVELQSLAGSQFHPEVVRAAVSILQEVELPSTVTQLPRTDLEKRRFSYFFNDKLTGLYNEDYLQIILRNNRSTNEYKCFHSIHLRNLPEYNRELGWEEGDLLLKKIADDLRGNFPDNLIFRVYGNDFALITRRHFDLNNEQFESFPSIHDTEIKVEVTHVDLIHEEDYTINKLEKLELLSGR